VPAAGTPYAGGFFRVKLILSKNFPSEPPKGFFLTKIFHPNVAQNGEICVNTLKRDWKAEFGIKHILLVSLIDLSLFFSVYNMSNLKRKCQHYFQKKFISHEIHEYNFFYLLSDTYMWSDYIKCYIVIRKILLTVFYSLIQVCWAVALFSPLPQNKLHNLQSYRLLQI